MVYRGLKNQRLLVWYNFIEHHRNINQLLIIVISYGKKYIYKHTILFTNVMVTKSNVTQRHAAESSWCMEVDKGL